MKFKPQRLYKVHSNYFIYNLFEPNENHRHKNFKAFFDFKNHLIKYPPKTKSPNWRVEPLFMLTEFIFPLIWMLGVSFYIDKMTMCFKGHHADKKGLCTKKNVVDYRHMIFVRKDTHITRTIFS